MSSTTSITSSASQASITCGIGSDFDGVTSLPTQLEDVSTYPRITAELLRRGYPADEIDRIMRKNILRVMVPCRGEVKEELAKP